ncbi:RagB/SusD family nutrient uptake outer membrane protein [Carboxylicivirga taeanensis]|uniref:RagB/SusD family nutrient uptake outer membrane protein n=1 Tax=Carboxylicivirga taeanensis TaxID=1416875 RepID=UPI003F6DAD51
MKRLFINFILVVTALGATSCNEWLDVSPNSDIKQQDLLTSEAGFNDVLSGVYSILTTEASYGRDMTFGYVDVLAQYYDRLNANDHIYFKAKDYLYEEPENKSTNARLWGTHYKAIVNLNSILSYIDQQQGVFSSDGVYQLYKGETLGLRAMIHFDLLRLFGPSPADGMNETAIPYMESYTNIAQDPLTTQQVLDKVIDDLESARELMRDYDLYGPNRASLQYLNSNFLINRQKHLNYYAITALLARVQLYAGLKAEALLTAKEIIGEPGGEPIELITLTSKPISTDRLFADEVLFWLDKPQLQDVISPYFGTAAASSSIQGNTNILSINNSSNSALYKALAPSDSDFRLSLWFQVSNVPSAVMPHKYTNMSKIPMVRVSELYYIAAECAQSTDDALAYLNKIRAHRGLAPIPETIHLQQEIEREYSKEFLCEGQMFFYYKRQNMTSIGVYRTVTDVSSEIYQLPVPLNEIEFGGY